ncbi:MAG: DUF2461 domain-containing protein [Candidatus Spyradocola sp.]|jgi:uncharacterized protein (TIGR02453 family)
MAQTARIEFSGVTQEMLDYFLGLALNNNREYYLSTKDVYEREVRAPLLDLAERLVPAALAVDPDMEQRPGHILSRIRRDTRFTKDKSPYRDHAWLSFRPMGRRKSGSFGLYCALGPQGCCYGAGFYDVDPARARRIREAILRQPDAFEAALGDPAFEARFALGGDDYRRMEPPAPLPPRAAALYRKKGVYFEHDDGLDGRVFAPGYAEEIAEGFRLLAPIYALLAGLA